MPSSLDHVSFPGTARVLLDRDLLAHVGAFMDGVPLLYREIHQQYLAKKSASSGCDNTSSNLWQAVIHDCKLKVVQDLYSMKLERKYSHLDFVQKVNVSICAAKFGRLDVLKWFATRADTSEWSEELLYFTVELKHYESARWLLRRHPGACAGRVTESMLKALEMRKFVLFKRMVKIKPDALNDSVMASAAASGCMEIVRYLDERYGYWPAEAMDCAARGGHLEVARFLHEHHSKASTEDRVNEVPCLDEVDIETSQQGCTTNAMDWAAANGHLEVVRFLHENRNDGCTEHAMNGAARGGHGEILHFLIANRIEGCTQEALALAADEGHLDITVSVHKEFAIKMTATKCQLITKAYRQGRIDIAHYLRDTIRVPCCKQELDSAITDGDLELVKLLHDTNHHEQPTEEATASAVEVVPLGVMVRSEPSSIQFRQTDLIDGLNDGASLRLPEDGLDAAGLHGIQELAKLEEDGDRLARVAKSGTEREHDEVGTRLKKSRKRPAECSNEQSQCKRIDWDTSKRPRCGTSSSDS